MNDSFLKPHPDRVTRAAGSNTGRSLEPLAQLIRTIYMTERRIRDQDPNFGIEPIAHWDGGITSAGIERRSVWLELAAFFVLNQYDACQFIMAQFELCPATRPLPTCFMSAAAVERYLIYTGKGASLKRTEFQSSLESFRAAAAQARGYHQLSPEQQLVQALTSNTLQATPLFRYCMAAQLRLPRVMAVYRDQALGHYLFSRQVYDEAWGDMIPPDFRMEALDLWNMLAR